MKIVLDTNSLIQSVPRQSRYHIVWESLVKGEHVLCVSNEILEEYQEILEQQITPTIAENIVLLILNQKNVQLVDPHFRLAIMSTTNSTFRSIWIPLRLYVWRFRCTTKVLQ